MTKRFYKVMLGKKVTRLRDAASKDSSEQILMFMKI